MNVFVRTRQLYFNRQGLTFVEMLVVVSIMSLVGFASFSSLSGGLKIADKAKQLKDNEDIRLFLERFKADIRNITTFSELSFDGEARSVSFSMLKNGPLVHSQDKHANKRLQWVRYTFIPYKNHVIREDADFVTLKKGDTLKSRVVLDGVALFDMRYLYYGNDNSLHQERFPKKGILPNFIKISMHCDTGSVEREVFSEYVEIPIAKKPL